MKAYLLLDTEEAVRDFPGYIPGVLYPGTFRRGKGKMTIRELHLNYPEAWVERKVKHPIIIEVESPHCYHIAVNRLEKHYKRKFGYVPATPNLDLLSKFPKHSFTEHLLAITKNEDEYNKLGADRQREVL